MRQGQQKRWAVCTDLQAPERKLTFSRRTGNTSKRTFLGSLALEAGEENVEEGIPTGETA